MSYRWAEHTAEVALEIDAPGETQAFEDAMLALRELLQDDGETPSTRRSLTAGPADLPERSVVSRRVEVAASDRAALLAAWLEELVYIAETEDLLPEQVSDLTLDNSHLAATVAARRGRPRHLVKGVTYSDLSFERRGEGVHATVVLDV
ncbi:MAG TPA: archease [Solirubrobacteraceae bacterium]|nr:archease [Solirubrobacteraceae bacterium]